MRPGNAAVYPTCVGVVGEERERGREGEGEGERGVKVQRGGGSVSSGAVLLAAKIRPSGLRERLRAAPQAPRASRSRRRSRTA